MTTVRWWVGVLAIAVLGFVLHGIWFSSQMRDYEHRIEKLSVIMEGNE
jgi:hypothetical protein